MDAPVPSSASAAPEGAELAKKQPRTLAQFLESSPPDVAEEVCRRVKSGIRGSAYLETPDLQIHCEKCEGVRTFYHNRQSSILIGSGLNYEFLTYVCRNCQEQTRTFSIVVKDTGHTGLVQKLGEHPPFGPPTPPRVMKLVGEDRELFLKGRRAELRGLGIGAFAYYRRVVEEQKGRIIEEIGKVAAKIKPSKETAELFAKAKIETQFSTAIDMIKSAIPETILIDGHNPLTLLHSGGWPADS